MTVKISIILPVYNVADYLPKCLNSLCNQTYRNIEIICINDGSADNSFSILEKYKKNDNRIIVINKQNEGVSVARNIRIKTANGEYILFVDPDDWIEKNTCEILLNKLNDFPDVLQFNHIFYNNGIRRKINNNKINKNDIIMRTYLWSRIYKKEFIHKNNIVFPEGYKYSEDFVFSNLIYLFNPKISVCDNYLYNYRGGRSGSASCNWSERIFGDIKSFEYLTNTEMYKISDTTKKLYIIDAWARVLFGCWCAMNEKKLQKTYDEQIDLFLNNYKIFPYKQYKNLIGYNRLKHKYLIKFLKYCRDLVYSFIYKNSAEDMC